MSHPMMVDGVEFVPVSPHLVTAKRVTTLLVTLPLLAAAVAVALLWTRWAWVAVALLALVALWRLERCRRLVEAHGYAEGEHDFLLREGLWIRTLSVIPYGRIQYVDVQQGPIERRWDLATLTLHTASPETSGTLEGLPMEEAARLRDVLAERGSAMEQGL